VFSVDVPACHPNIDCVCLDLVCQGTSFRIVNIYRAAAALSADEKRVMEALLLCLSSVCCNDTVCLVCGDFNCPNIDWVNSSIYGDMLQKMFYDFRQDLGFNQLVLEPTRGSNILDLIMCNDSLFVTDVRILPPFSNSDHNCVECYLNIILSQTSCSNVTFSKSNIVNQNKKKNIKTFLWHKAKWSQLDVFYSNVDWSILQESTSNADGCFNLFYNVIYAGIERFVPSKTTFCNSRHKSVRRVRYPRNIKKLLVHKTKT